ncbi:DUF4160 domain-containing protein [Pseudomonas monteilii]|uniref:DUF4160 domain-containing protein n=1 Tax=Pseudomonas monteilii TaxID=76759 RepID=UPI0036E17466
MEKPATDLQRDLAMVDMMSRPASRSGFTELLLLKMQPLKIRMEPDHHARAHVHIDYGRALHTASFAVDTGERLVGQLPRKYDKEIAGWIEKNRPTLLQAWDEMKSGKDPRVTLADLDD